MHRWRQLPNLGDGCGQCNTAASRLVETWRAVPEVRVLGARAQGLKRPAAGEGACCGAIEFGFKHISA